MFGKDERINGYEGLSVDISLSAKRLIPYVQINYTSKAPAYTNIDNLKEILSKHYGKIYDCEEEFQTVLTEEKTSTFPGQHLSSFTLNGTEYALLQIAADDESFLSQNHYLQAILHFFIDGASFIQPCLFWKYYLVYELKSQSLVAFTTVFEAY
jgi:hypothetical protein